jgi:hypothetical protein
MQLKGIQAGIPVRNPVTNDSEFIEPSDIFSPSGIHQHIERNGTEVLQLSTAI